MFASFQGRSPSDVSDVETAVSEEQPIATPKARPTAAKVKPVVVVQEEKGPAAVHPAQRRVVPLKSDSRGSTLSESGRGWDTPEGSITSEVEVTGEGGEGGDLSTWKEPPVVRKLGGGSGGGSGGGRGGGSRGRGGGGRGRGGGGRGRGRGGSPSHGRGDTSTRGRGISVLSEPRAVPTDQRPRGGEPEQSPARAAKWESARAPTSEPREERQRSNSDSQTGEADFWNPLGPEDGQSQSSQPSGGVRRGSSRRGSRGGTGEDKEEDSSQHSAAGAAGAAPVPSSRRGSGRGLRRGVPFVADPSGERRPGGKTAPGPK